MSIARTTPAQKPRGLSRRTRLVDEVTFGSLVSGSSMVEVTLQVYRVHPSPTSRLHHESHCRWYKSGQKSQKRSAALRTGRRTPSTYITKAAFCRHYVRNRT